MNQTLNPIGDGFLKRVYNCEQNFTEKELKLLTTEYDEFDYIEGDHEPCYRTDKTILKIEDKYFSIEWEQGLTEKQENEYLEQPKQVILTQETKTITVNHYTDV